MLRCPTCGVINTDQFCAYCNRATAPPSPDAAGLLAASSIPENETPIKRFVHSRQARLIAGIACLVIGMALPIAGGIALSQAQAFDGQRLAFRILLALSFALIAFGVALLPRSISIILAAILLLGGIASYIYGVTSSDNALFLVGGVVSGIFGGFILLVKLKWAPAE